MSAKRSPKGIPAPTPYNDPSGVQRSKLNDDGKTVYGWRLRFTHPKDLTRSEVRVWTRTPQEAATLLSEKIKESAIGLRSTKSVTKTTLISWLAQWVADYAWVRVGEARNPSTWKEHDSNMRLYINPYLSGRVEDTGSRTWAQRPLSQFRPEDLEEVISKYRLANGQNPSDSGRKSVTKTLRMSLNAAVKAGLITRSPAADIDAKWEISGVKSFTPKPWEMETVAALMGQRLENGEVTRVPIDYLGDMVRFLFWSGLRPAEALALRRTDINFDNNYLTVTKQATIASGRRVEKSELKTRQSRRIAILMPLAFEPAMQLFRRSQVKSDYLLMGEGRRPREKDAAGNWVTSETVRAIGYGTLARYLREASAVAIAAGAITDSITMTSLRHGFASSCLSIGMDPNRVSRFMGHSSTRLTTGLYGLDQFPTDMTEEVEEIRHLQESLMEQELDGFAVLDAIQIDMARGLTNAEMAASMAARVRARSRIRGGSL